MIVPKTTNKIPISEFCVLVNKNRRQVHTLAKNHPFLTVKIPGEKEGRVNMDEWTRILNKA